MPQTGAEYQPEMSLSASRTKLRVISTTHIEVSAKQLFEAACDVLASRGGKRWKEFDPGWLTNSSQLLRIHVLYRPANSDWEHINLVTRDIQDEEAYYRVSRMPTQGEPDIYELERADGEGDFEAVDNLSGGSLASARLYSILADAHYATRKSRARTSSID